MNFIPPPPAPAPPPPPTNSSTATPFGLTSSQSFATFGILSSAGADKYKVDPVDPGAIQLSWSAEANAYRMTFPGFPEAKLTRTYADNPRAFTPADSDGNRLPVAVTLAAAGNVGLTLRYSDLGYYSTYPDQATQPYLYGAFVYGVPTLAADVPTTGSASYDARILGWTTSNNGYDVFGDVRLNFDFSAGSLSGYMRPRLYSDWDGVDRALDQYNFTQTVYSVGSPTFSGKFDVTNAISDSAFQGQFTGPGAAEMIAGWKAPYLDPFDNTWKSMGGVWLGKKQ